MGEPFWFCNFFLSIYPSSYSILILWFFFLKNYFDSESWRKKIGWTGEKNIFRHFHSIIIYLPFSQYNHLQNFEEKYLFQHFANLIKIRSTHLLPILSPRFLCRPTALYIFLLEPSESYAYGKQRIRLSASWSAYFHVSWLSDFIFYQKPLYKSLHQSFFYSFITILPSESGVTLHYSTILP